jgi:hypothetical protein
MARIDDPTIRNPFGWRLADLAEPVCDDTRHVRLTEELLVCEAEELAHGHRHLSVFHGDPTDLASSRRLSGFYDTLARLAGGCDWVRVRGDVGYVTVTVRGVDANEQLTRFADAAQKANPGDWRIAATAIPPGAT